MSAYRSEEVSRAVRVANEQAALEFKIRTLQDLLDRRTRELDRIKTDMEEKKTNMYRKILRGFKAIVILPLTAWLCYLAIVIMGQFNLPGGAQILAALTIGIFGLGGFILYVEHRD